MSVSGLGYRILRASTALQVAVYEYLNFDLADQTGVATIETIVKELAALTRKLKKEDGDV